MSMIKLKLSGGESLEHISAWKEFENIELDSRFGIVCISPQQQLFVIRVVGKLDEEFVDKLNRAKNPKILGAFGNIKISTTKEKADARQHQSDGSVSRQPTDGNRGNDGNAKGCFDNVDSRNE